MKRFATVFAFLVVISFAARAQTTDQLLAQARGFLAQNDPAGARTRIESALALAPNHPDANVLMAAARLMTLGDTPAGGAFLNRLGFSAEGRNVYNWFSKVPMDSNNIPAAPINFSAAEITAFLRTNVLPALRASGTNLARITDTNYFLRLHLAETADNAAALDYGDIQMLHALLRLGEGAAYTVYSWNADIQLTTLRGYFTNETATIEQFLAENPHLLTFSTTNDLLAAKSALLIGAQNYFAASAFIRARPPGLLRVFNLDAERAGDEVNFRQFLVELTNSLTAPVVLTVESNLTVHLAPLFAGTLAPRPLLPSFHGNSLLLGTLPDPTYGGTIQGFPRFGSEEFLARYFDTGSRLNGTMRPSPKRFELKFATLPNRAYAVEYSPDLLDWMELGDFHSQGSDYTFTDLTATNDAIRYYRLVDLSEYVSVAGQVINACSGSPISNATISTTLDGVTATTDASGNFFLQSRTYPDFFDFEVEAQAPGFANTVLFLWAETDHGGVKLALLPNATSAPANNQFANRFTLSGVAPAGSGSTCGATREVSEPAGTGGSVWWQWTAPFSGGVEIYLESFSYDAWPTLDVYVGNTLPTLSRVGGYYFTASAGQTYQIRFSGDAVGFRFDLGGEVILDLTQPFDGSEFTSPTDIQVQATFSSASPLREARIYANWELIAEVTNAPIDFLWGNVPPGEYWLAIDAISTAERYGYAEAFITVFPSNDNFDDRIAIVSTNVMVTGDNTLASHEFDEPDHAGAFGEYSLWWTWTAPANGAVTWTATGEQRGAGNASALAVYTGSDLASLIEVASNSDGTPYGSQVSFHATAGVTYQIAVDGWETGPLELSWTSGAAPSISFDSPTDGEVFVVGDPIDFLITVNDTDGSLINLTLADESGVLGSLALSLPAGGTVFWPFTPSASEGYYQIRASVLDDQGLIGHATIYFEVVPPPPANDLFADRLPLLGMSVTATGHNAGATWELDEPDHVGASGGVSVWWTWTAPTNGPVTIDTLGSSFDTVLAVYTGGSLSILNLIAEDDESGGGGQSELTFLGSAGTIYQIAVDGYFGSTGDIVLHVSQTTAALQAYTFTTLAGLAGNLGSGNGTGSVARFNLPRGITVDNAGNVYVTDSSNHTIRKVSPLEAVTTVAGLAGTSGSINSTGIAARFSSPVGLALDSTCNLYVGDGGNHMLRKITNGGAVTTFAGFPGSIGSADGAAHLARFNSPFGLALDSAGTAYVADTYNNTIRKITPAGIVSTLAGLAGNSGSANGTGSVARFNYPFGLTADGTGNVFVADTSNHTIRKVTPAGVVSTFAGMAGNPGSANGTGSVARFTYPYGLTIDSVGNMYVADYGNHTIRKVTPAGLVSTVGGLAGSLGSANGTGSAARFYHPSGITVDSAGNLYVTDTYNHTIRKGVYSP